jgi:predicted acylesterase/phospholipase RssA
VRASASVPLLFPPISVNTDEDMTVLLTDGGVSDSLPIEFAQRPPLDATHIIVSDCRWLPARRIRKEAHVVHIRPRLASTGTLWAPTSTLVSAVREGRRAVTGEILSTIRDWMQEFAT